jgi:ferredoxin
MDGLRAGEALGLQWGDIDFDRQLLSIRRSAWYGKVQTVKTHSSETVLPIPDALAAILKEYRTHWTANPNGFLFATRNGRPPSSNKVVEYHLWTILDALGIPRCGLHAFRHTHTALLLHSGATPKVVQRQLRHAGAPDGNAILVPKHDADSAMDAAACIGCGACVAACPKSSASLFTAAKVTHLGLLPQGQPERARRVLAMVARMDEEGFGNCSWHGECQAACPKSISIDTIARMNRDWFLASLSIGLQR